MAEPLIDSVIARRTTGLRGGVEETGWDSALRVGIADGAEMECMSIGAAGEEVP
jgi:hypothetical protein